MEQNNSKAFYSGFVAVVGKPNVGKSTLVNAMTGKKVAITSPRPQTTRHRIMGIKNGKNFQAVFVDTPGVKPPKNELDSFMEKIYRDESKDADVVLFVVDGSKPYEQEDILVRDILKKISSSPAPVYLVVNKMDLVQEEERELHIGAYGTLGNFAGVFPVSAVNGSGFPELEKAIREHLPEGPAYFPPDATSDQSAELFAAEIVRENILRLIDDEIPHGVFVHTEEVRQGIRPGNLYMRIVIYVERTSHKGIIIGKEGRTLKKIGSASRKELEGALEQEVYLDLWVKVKEKWKQRKDLLRSWGYA